MGALLVAGACYVGQELSFALRFPPARFTTIWFPGGVMLAALLVTPPRRWWAYVLGSAVGLFTALVAEVPLHLAFVGPVLTVAYRVALAAALRRASPGSHRFDNFRQVVLYLLIAGLIGPALMNLVSASVAVGSGWRDDFWLAWRVLFLADVTAHVTVTPAITVAVSGGASPFRSASGRRYLEAGALGLILLGLEWLAFGGSWSGRLLVLTYAPLPLLLWAAVRFGPGGTSLAFLLTVWIATWNAVHGLGPFTSGAPADDVLSLQLFLLATSVPLLFLAAVVRDRQQTAAALRASHRQTRDLAGRLIVAQEAERARIARDLHDDINQQLAALSIALSGLRRRLPEGAKVREELALLQRRVIDLADDVRALSHELHPGVLRHAGLVSTLRAHAAEFGSRQPISVTIDADEGINELPPELALCLYRVAQEALRNVARHAGATCVRVTLARTAGGLALTITDDGQGFDLAAGRPGRGLGLISLEERVRLVGGIMRIDTRPRWGTEVRVEVPVGGRGHEPRPTAARG
jgi:two-component system sensor histidine kinase UhpB